MAATTAETHETEPSAGTTDFVGEYRGTPPPLRAVPQRQPGQEAFRSCSMRKPEPDDAAHDQAKADQPGHGGRFLEEHNAEYDRAHRSDAGPDSIGGAHRQGFHGHTQQDDTDDHRKGGPRQRQYF